MRCTLKVAGQHPEKKGQPRRWGARRAKLREALGLIWPDAVRPKKVMNNKWCPLSLDIFVSRDTEGRTAALCCQGTARTPVINKSTGLHYQCQCNAGDDPSFVCRDEAKEQTGRDVGVKLTRNAICIAPSSGNGSSCGSSSSSSVPSRPGVRLTRPRTAASIAEPKPHSRLDPCR